MTQGGCRSGSCRMGRRVSRSRVASHSDLSMGWFRTLRYFARPLTASVRAALEMGGWGPGGSCEEPAGRPVGAAGLAPEVRWAVTDPRGDFGPALVLAADLTSGGGSKSASVAHWSAWQSTGERGSAAGAPGALMRRTNAATLAAGISARAKGRRASGGALAAMTRPPGAKHLGLGVDCRVEDGVYVWPQAGASCDVHGRA